MKKCNHCKKSILPSDLKVWRYKGWVVYGKAPSAPERKGGKYDEWDIFFHNDCFIEFDLRRYLFFQELDMPINNCQHFVRDGHSMRGWYKRDGKSCKCLGFWLESTINGTNLFPYLEDGDWADLQEFRKFLDENGWTDSWYQARNKDQLLKEFPNEKSRWWFSKQWYGV